MFEIEKIFEDDLFHGYAVSRLTNGEGDYVLFASEENAPCVAYDLNNNFEKQEIWSDVGGTMSIVQIGQSLDFLATQKFYPGFRSAQCQIVRGIYNGSGWDIEKVMDFPYLHRFDLISDKDSLLFVGCTICKSKKDIEDWSDPGEVFVGKFDAKANQFIELKALDTRLTKNHGYLRVEEEPYCLITADEGIFKLDFPTNKKDWQLQQIFDKKVSDVAVVDIDSDGFIDYLTIEDFHGSEMHIYDNKFKEKYKYPRPTPFGHVVHGSIIDGKPMFVFGSREGDRNLFLIGYDHENKKFYTIPIEEGVGASNIALYQKESQYFIASANREINKIAFYKIEKRDIHE